MGGFRYVDSRRGCFRSRMSPRIVSYLLALLFVRPVAVASGEQPATVATYRMLPGHPGRAAPFESVTVTRDAPGRDGRTEWELQATAKGASDPAFRLRVTSEADPLDRGLERREIERYALWIPATKERYEYRDRTTGRALVPEWREFTTQFFPVPAPAAPRRDGVPVTCRFLGHVLSLERVASAGPLAAWSDVRVLTIDSGLQIGTGRTVKDREERRLPQTPEPRDYDYVEWSRSDYEDMIAAGFNSFALVPGIEAWLRGQPVFYRRGPGGDAPLRWPADFYRSNFQDSVMFEDEPACVMLRDETLQKSIRSFTDLAEVLRARIRSTYARESRALERHLRARGEALGDLVLAQPFPVWETRYETAWYQLEAGFSGFVHEGRYHLEDFYQSGHSFDAWVEASTGIAREHTAGEMLRFHYAFLRGAARHHGKHWGTSIYGQADPDIAPLAVTLAYDLGARWVWFWTSDHGHHLPWPEQLALARHLRAHQKAHPRPSIREPATVERAIVLPRGSFLFIESPTARRNPWDLWWLRALDPAGENEASRRYRGFRRRALSEVHRALDTGTDFAITVDDGRPIDGYREVVRIEPP